VTISAEDAMGRLWDMPLETSEIAGGETLPAAVDVAALAIERGEATVRDALTIAFAAGAYFNWANNLRPAADPPTADDGAG
jgi:predicted ThiF/HesA family dinucleotide-utilizing enzyme